MAPSEKAKKQKKKRRPSSRSRPAPPPPPPASLVNLLQHDGAVLKYFQSLQANLDADVQVWKDRALQQKEETEKLQKELEKLKSNKKRTSATKKRKSSATTTTTRKSSAKEEKRKKAQGAATTISKSAASAAGEKTANAVPELPEQGEPINDSMLGALFDSDDDDDDSDSDDDTLSSVRANDKQMNAEEEAEAENKNDKREIFAFLQEAHDALTSLGVILADEIQLDDDDESEKEENEKEDQEATFSFGDDKADDENLPPKKVTTRFLRRSDERVMVDILDRIQNNTLAPRNAVDDEVNNDEECVLIIDVNNNYDLLPACNPQPAMLTTTIDEPTHPLLQGKRLLFRTLLILDTFCDPKISSQQWDSYFTATESVDDRMKLGLRGRQRVVDHLLQFLTGEISNRWACADRSLYRATTVVHYNKNETRNAAESLSLLGSATSRSRLGGVVERSETSQLASALHLSRNCVADAAYAVLHYIVSSTPSLTLEEYPKLPPVLSLVTLEGLLLISDSSLIVRPLESLDGAVDDQKDATSWFIRYLSTWCNQDYELQLLLRSLALAVHAAGSIWKERLASSDERIHDVACVEIATYKRLVKSESWLRETRYQASNKLDIDWRNEARKLVNETLDVDGWRSARNEGSDPTDAKLVTLQIALLLHGDTTSAVNSIIHESLEIIDETTTVEKMLNLRDLLLVSVNGTRNAVLRQLDSYRRQIGSLDQDLIQIIAMSDLTSLLLTRSGQVSLDNRYRLFCFALECSSIITDGNTAARAVQHIIQAQEENHNQEVEVSLAVTRMVLDIIRRTSKMPVVRVINLETRSDRMQAFLSQAFRERLLVVKAVTNYNTEKERSNNINLKVADGFEFGLNAIDGRGRLAEATSRIVEQIGSLSLVDKLVKPEWRPNDLKAFDRDAPDVEALVRMTPSERACALSHICSWKGVCRSLKVSESESNDTSPTANTPPKLLRYPNHLSRLYKISGFAEGPALLTKNDNMPPAPVCVILEDDAILVDRFAERLADLLKELPRDFHFCSLGYSRPKSAPIVPHSSKIGIPSMLWYLTGYCISEAGANYLLDSLPVVGPVDSWIGLKMTNNWDNSFGVALGVGVHAKPNSELPAHRDLCRILQFRAYCALQPLCTQKVRVAAADATGGTVVAARTGRNWRQRDTDIEYSGDLAKTGMLPRR